MLYFFNLKTICLAFFNNFTTVSIAISVPKCPIALRDRVTCLFSHYACTIIVQCIISIFLYHSFF